MKTQFLTITIAMLLTFSFVNAQTSESVKKCRADVQLTAENQVVVRYLETNNQKIKIAVYNQDGEKLDNRSFKTDGMLKVTYNVKKFAGNDLIFKVSCNGQSVCSEMVSVNESGMVSIPVELNSDYSVEAKQMLVSNK